MAESSLPSPLLPPGLVGDVARWVDSCAIRPAPMLSLCASIATVATLCGRRYALSSGLRPALQIVGVAGSGVGKDVGRKCAVALLRAAGCPRYVGTDDIASAAGLVAQLRECPTKLFLSDELGRMLEAYSSKNAASHERQIVTTMMKLWSSADATYLGKAYAEKASSVVEQPHFVLYGTTTPARFIEALKGSDVVDGVISRMVIVQQDGGMVARVARKPGEARGRHDDPPTGLVSRARALAKGVGDGNLTDIDSPDQRTSPHVVTHGAGVDELLRAIDAGVVARAQGAAHPELWVRAEEQSLRLALAVCLGRGSLVLEIGDLEWAWAFVKWSLRRSEAVVVTQVADTEEGRCALAVMAVVRAAAARGEFAQDPETGRPMMGARKTEVVGKLSRFDTRVREAAVRTLVDAGSISVQSVQAAQHRRGRGHRPSTWFVLPPSPDDGFDGEQDQLDGDVFDSDAPDAP